MAKIAKSADRLGRFSRSRDSAPMPISVDLRSPGDFRDGVEKAMTQARDARRYLHDASDQSQRHPTKRLAHRDGHPEAASSGDEGGAWTVTGARSAAELQHQIGLLTDAFRREEKREPTAEDAGFWQAYRKLITAYAEAAAEHGSPKRATEPLATTSVRKDGRPVPAWIRALIEGKQ